jgi:hypothetical protein
VDRRNFFFSLAGFSALLSQPMTAPQDASEGETEALEVSNQIKALEDHIRKYPEPFPWTQHNELRHLYGAIIEPKSMQHADIILAHCLMDDYILSVLSDWQLEGDQGIAAVNLLTKVEKYPSFLHLRAASLMKVGDLCQEHGKAAEAERLYLSVAKMVEANLGKVPGLKPYGILAQVRLGRSGWRGET